MAHFLPKSTTQDNKIRTAQENLHEAQSWRGRLGYFLAELAPQAEKIPTMAERLNQVSRCKCRLGCLLGRAPHPREQHSNRAP